MRHNDRVWITARRPDGDYGLGLSSPKARLPGKGASCPQSVRVAVPSEPGRVREAHVAAGDVGASAHPPDGLMLRTSRVGEEDGGVSTSFRYQPPIAALRDAAGLWLAVPRDRSYAEALIMAAAHALASGVDTPSLRELAGLSTRAILPWSFPEVVRSLSVELELSLPEPKSDAAQGLALRSLCRQSIDGSLAPRAVAGWAHRYVGHEGPAELQDLVELDDEYDVQGPSAELDERVLTAARALLR